MDCMGRDECGKVLRYDIFGSLGFHFDFLKDLVFKIDI